MDIHSRARLLWAAAVGMATYLFFDLIGDTLASHCPFYDRDASDCANAATTAKNPILNIVTAAVGAVAGWIAKARNQPGVVPLPGNPEISPPIPREPAPKAPPVDKPSDLP